MWRSLSAVFGSCGKGFAGGASGCGPGSRQGLQGLVQGAGQQYLAVQPGNAEQLADLRSAADRVQAAAAGGSTLGRADQRGEPGGVDEADLIQVGHQRAATGCQFEKALAYQGHCGNVDLPGGGHDHVVLFVSDLDGQWIAHGPASPAGLAVVLPGLERPVSPLARSRLPCGNPARHAAAETLSRVTVAGAMDSGRTAGTGKAATWPR